MNRPIHFEILADDPQKISAFYQSTLGWTIAAWEGGEQGYWLVTTGSEETAGINGALMHRHFPQGVINTIEVQSLDEMMEKVKAAGGKLLNEPNDVPGAGRHVYCADPEGNIFGMIESSS